MVTECAEKISTKHPNRWLALRFCTDREGAIGKYNVWAREPVGLLVLFSKVGDGEYVPKHSGTPDT